MKCRSLLDISVKSVSRIPLFLDFTEARVKHESISSWKNIPHAAADVYCIGSFSEVDIGNTEFLKSLSSSYKVGETNNTEASVFVSNKLAHQTVLSHVYFLR